MEHVQDANIIICKTSMGLVDIRKGDPVALCGNAVVTNERQNGVMLGVATESCNTPSTAIFVQIRGIFWLPLAIPSNIPKLDGFWTVELAEPGKVRAALRTNKPGPTVIAVNPKEQKVCVLL